MTAFLNPEEAAEAATHFVANRREQQRPSNTTLAYAKKEEEWYAFCQGVYGSATLPALGTRESDTTDLFAMNEKKAFLFLVYQTHREKRHPRKGRNSGAAEEAPSSFILSDYQEIMQKLLVPGGDGNMQLNEMVTIGTTNVCGSSILRQYRAALKHIHMKQQQNNPLHSTSLWLHILESNRIKGLEDYVNRRAPAAKKARYEEKVDINLMPYKMVESKGRIEELLWNIGSDSRVGGLSGLRDRF
jgi:hypothetical protein